MGEEEYVLGIEDVEVRDENLDVGRGDVGSVCEEVVADRGTGVKCTISKAEVGRCGRWLHSG